MNQYQEVISEETELSLKDIFSHLLHHWRSFLSTILICALLAGCLAGVSYLKSSKVNKTPLELQQYETDKKNLEIEIMYLEQAIKNQQVYLNDSIKMKLDPMAFYSATLSFFIENDYQIMPGMTYQNRDTAPWILSAYVNMLNSEKSLNKIAEHFQIPSWALREVVRVDTDSSRLLEITIQYPDQETCEQISMAYQHLLADFHDTVVQSVGDHSVRFIQDSSANNADIDLEAVQFREFQKLGEYKTKLLEDKNALEDLKSPSSGFGVKKSVLIVLVGIFLVACFYGVQCLMSHKVFSYPEFMRRCKIKFLGNLSSDRKLNPIDRWIAQLEHRAIDSKGSDYALVAANVQLNAGNAVDLVVTGGTNMDVQLCKIVTEQLQKQLSGLTLHYAGNLQRDADCVSALKNCGGVVMLQQCGISDYRNITEEAYRVQDAEIPLVGCVIIER